MMRVVLVIVMLLLVSSGAPESVLGAPIDTTPGATWDTRLEALTPSAPAAYFELAEEVVDAARTDADRALARHLFALAGGLDPDRLGRSACLALADMEAYEPDRRRLQALAGLLGSPVLVPAAAGTALQRAAAPEPTSAAILAVTDALSYYRRGSGSQAMTQLDKPGAMALLESARHLLPGGLERFIEECQGLRAGLAPYLTDGDLVALLELERAILSGIDRPWSSELLLREGRALLELDPSNLESALGVSLEHSWYRDGRWVARSN